MTYDPEPRAVDPYRFWDDSLSLSPFTHFTASQWSDLRAETGPGLTEKDLSKLRSVGDAVSLVDVDHVYLPLSRVLRSHFRATRSLMRDRAEILNHPGARTPFVIAIAGSVAVGKSTTARLIRTLVADWPENVSVDLVTTDGFLLPTAELDARGLMTRKGFPESYDRTAMLRFLRSVKAGEPEVHAPVYSHLRYDIDPTRSITVRQPDVLIFEGLNVLQTPAAMSAHAPVPLASDYFDFAIYVDAAEPDIADWYIKRFLVLRETAFSQKASHFRHYASLSGAEAEAKARELWETINAVNLRENILPTRGRADLVMRKGADHRVCAIALRKL